MLRRGHVRVGDLRPAPAPGPRGLLDAVERAPSWLIVGAACALTLAALAAIGGPWLARDRRAPEQGPARSAAAAPPAIFPPWVAVPHLSDGPSGGDPSSTASTDRPDARPGPPRSFLTPRPEAADRLAGLPQRADPRLPALRLVPPDGARLARAAVPADPSPPEPSAPETATVSPDLARTLGPTLLLRARSPAPPRAPVRPIVEARRPAEPRRDADQTASIVGRPASGRPRIDAGAVARASVRRPDPEPRPGAPRPWTLPPALAPTP